MRHARWVPATAGTAALDETERHVRAHLSSVADGADDLDRYTAAVQVCRVDGEGGTTVVGELDRLPTAPYLRERRASPRVAVERLGSGLMFARAVMDGLARHGVPVLTENGWETRGNGQTADYQGAIMHHTAARSSARNPEPSRRIVVDGRPDLRGPLCNSLGGFDGSIRIIAAHPANHAGASGGRSMGPLPVTRTFNRLVWGHEIDYAGTVPMSPEQYRSAVALGAVISDLLGRTDAEWIRGHGETSITGKWDPGFAPPSQMIDMNRFRADVKWVRGGPSLPTSHVVARGETLTAIATRYYGRSDRWRDIYAANSTVIGPDPNRLVPGQVLVIPA